MAEQCRETRQIFVGRDGAVLLVAAHHQLHVIGEPGRTEALEALLQPLQVIARIGDRACRGFRSTALRASRR